ncbi:hypothetical protein E4U49_006959 [Claviceps purpurea]|nr:hypothetical protein E4U49_006959 [Claviceps purpurea]
MALSTNEQNEASALCQLIQELERQIQQRARQLQKETDRTLQQAEQIGSILQLVQEGERRNEKRKRRNEKREAALEQQLEEALEQIEKQDRKLQRAKRRERQSQDEATELEHERDEALWQLRQEMSRFQMERRDRIERFCKDIIITEREGKEARRALQQSEERARGLEQERDTILQRLQEIDPLFQPSTLGEFIEESHASLFSKLTIDPNAGGGSDVTTTNLRGKWRPEKVMEWPCFLSEQRLIFDNIFEAFPSELRAFPPPMTVRKNGNKLAPITDKDSLARFVGDSIEEQVKNIMNELESVDKLGMVCQCDVRVDFINHPEHAKSLETESTSSQPGEPVSARFCIRRDPAVGMASTTMLYVWEHKAPYDLTVEDLRAALRPTTTFGDVIAETGSPSVENEDAEEVSQSTVTAEQRVNRAVTQIYHNMMESCLEFGILTTGQAIVFVHVNWDDPQTLFYHIAEPAIDVAQAPEKGAAFFSAVGQFMAFTIMALTKRSKPLQERRMRVFRTLSKWGMPSGLPSHEHDNASLIRSGPQAEEFDAEGQGQCKQNEQTTITGQKGGGDQDSNPDQPYCSQKCLLGLVRGESLDPECPNVTLHYQGEAGAGHPYRHPVDHAEWLHLLREQFKQSLDEGIICQSVFGARGALFKVTLLAYGYTFVSKGTVSGHGEHLEHEARVYERLKPIQGQRVPVFLGAIDLRTLEKDYWINFGTYVVHMMFVSWGGVHVDQNKVDRLDILHEVPVALVDESIRTLKAVHNEGVLHCDVQWGNVLFNPETKGIMVIDFERAELLDGPESSELHIEAYNEERATEEEHEISRVIQGALGILDTDCRLPLPIPSTSTW